MRFPQSKLDELLKKWFYHLGVFIGHHPGYFIIVPALLTALFATGFQQLVWNYDPGKTSLLVLVQNTISW